MKVLLEYNMLIQNSIFEHIYTRLNKSCMNTNVFLFYNTYVIRWKPIDDNFMINYYNQVIGRIIILYEYILIFIEYIKISVIHFLDWKKKWNHVIIFYRIPTINYRTLHQVIDENNLQYTKYVIY